MQGYIFTLLILNFSLFSHLSARTLQSLPDTAYRIPRTQPEEGAPIDGDISFVDEEYLEQEYLTDYSNSAQSILGHESQNSKQGKNPEKFDSELDIIHQKDLKTNEFLDNSLLKHLNKNSSLSQMTGSKNSSSFNHTEPKGEIKRLPQAIIIGVKKSGTRALLQFLRTHPNIRSPGPEIHFFDKHYDNGLEWYRSQMPSTLPGQITVEKTPSYWITKPAPQRVYSMSPQTSLIVVVRDPTTRALSDYTQASSKRPDIGTFEKMAFVDNYTVDTSWGAIRIGLYALHFSNWISYFPRERIHFVSGERLVTHPAEELAKVQDFLGLERLITDKHFYFNTTKGFPCLVKSEGSASPRCLGKTKGRPHPVVDPAVLSRLRKFYYPFNEKFYRMTGIDFGWPVS